MSKLYIYTEVVKKKVVSENPIEQYQHNNLSYLLDFEARTNSMFIAVERLGGGRAMFLETMLIC